MMNINQQLILLCSTDAIIFFILIYSLIKNQSSSFEIVLLPCLYGISFIYYMWDLKEITRQWQTVLIVCAYEIKLVCLWITLQPYILVFYITLIQQFSLSKRNEDNLSIVLIMTSLTTMFEYSNVQMNVTIIAGIVINCVWILKLRVDKIQTITQTFQTGGHQDLVSPKEQFSDEVDPWQQLTWLHFEKYMIIETHTIALKYKSFNLEVFSLSPQQSIYEHFLSQKVRGYDLSGSLSLKNQQVISLRKMLQEMSVKPGLNHLFQIVTLMGNEFDLFSHVLCIYHWKGNFVLHFQMDERVNSHNTLKDICKSVSHELGTSLNCISTLSSVGLNEQKIDKLVKDEYLLPININSEQLNLIISNIRDFAIMETDRFELKLNEFVIQSSIEEIVNYFKQVCIAKKITIQIPTGMNTILSDQDRVKQILYQMISNAIRYSNQGGNIDLTIHLHRTHVIITVKDDGLGMSLDEQCKLQKLLSSDSMVRVSKSSVGCGFGLFISNLIARKLNCDEENPIGFKSSFREGSEFSLKITNMNFKLEEVDLAGPKIRRRHQSYVHIMRVGNIKSYIESNTFTSTNKVQMRQLSNVRGGFSREIENLSHRSSVHLEPTQMMQQLISLSPKFQSQIMEYGLKSSCCSRVLIVDDEYFNIFSLKLLLSRYGTICDDAYNGREALDKIKKKLEKECPICKNLWYQLIFLDINMPIMDGITAVRFIKEMETSGKIKKPWCIANTAFSDAETKDQSYMAGMDFVLIKPLNCAELHETIRRIFPPMN